MGAASMDQAAITRFLTAMGDEARLQIALLLLDKGPMNVGDIAAQFRLSRPTISHHLKVLKDARIVQSEKRAQEIFYRVDNVYVVGQLRELADLLSDCTPEG
jgi:ArsR family transcriptional regulator, arsenate/arsenite/antimonite-responsive transcriptional repressor